MRSKYLNITEARVLNSIYRDRFTYTSIQFKSNIRVSCDIRNYEHC